MDDLYFDFETYSSEDISKSGAYRYTQSPDFEILLLAYAINDGPVNIIDVTQYPFFDHPIYDLFYAYLFDPTTRKHAHNANFERQCLKAYGINVPIYEFDCSAVKALYCGLPGSLDGATKALNLNESKDAKGKALIRYFCCPVKPTKSNNFQTRNFPSDDPEKWEAFKEYCKQDVEAERALIKSLANYELPKSEKNNYYWDQVINDRGVKIDVEMAQNAISIDDKLTSDLQKNLRKITNLDNPNSGAQFKKWLLETTGEKVTSLAKDSFQELFKLTDDPAVLEALNLYSKGSKTSTSKYVAALNSVGYDKKIRGIIQFYGANRTGRYAGRLVQVHNLPRNYMPTLDLARTLVCDNDYESLDIVYDDMKKVLSELIRTMFIPDEGYSFGVLDFSAIEARVLAWLAGEKWRLDVFNTHGKIYEASASMMFNIPIEQITKGSDYRTKGKVAELALGYQGSVGAMERMGGASMGLSAAEMKSIVTKWRKKNPKIVNSWENYQDRAIKAITHKGRTFWCDQSKLSFRCDDRFLMIGLPSGRSLFYCNPIIKPGKFGETITFMGYDDKNVWSRIDTYGGKLAENVTQAVSRDLLAYSIEQLELNKIPVSMHVHDEVIILIKDEETFKKAEKIMSTAPSWAKDLPLKAEGFITQYYKKD